MELSEKMYAAIRASARDAKAEAREEHADNPDALRSIQQIEDMLAQLLESAYEAGQHDRMLAVAFEEGHESGEDYGREHANWEEYGGSGKNPLRRRTPMANESNPQFALRMAIKANKGLRPGAGYGLGPHSRMHLDLAEKFLEYLEESDDRAE